VPIFSWRTRQRQALTWHGSCVLCLAAEYVADIVSYTPGVAADSEFKVACNTRLHKRVSSTPQAG